jgi:ATP-binding cassette subfamily F protein uup
VIAGRPNVLFLDEPTNDFDLDTLRILEDFLEDWPGALVVISHDRTFLDRTTSRLVAVNANGTVTAVPGGVAGWIAKVEGGDRRRAGALSPSTPSPGTSIATKTRTPVSGGGSAPIGRLLREAEKNCSRLLRECDKVILALTETDDYVELTRLGSELAATRAALECAEEEWLALAEEAESGS